jgi:uncharacterized protein YkwD
MRRSLLACVVLSIAALALPTSANASVEQSMVDSINAVRAEHGVAPVQHAPRLSRSCSAYAKRMLKSRRWAHANSTRVAGFRGVAEILARTPRRTAPGPVIRMWLNSAVHRKVLLGNRYRHVGVGTKTGRMGGKRTTLWVVRFAR